MAPDTKTIDVGNFTNGMVPDVIGAADSMIDIVDGWFPRVGEIRKRGGKTLFESIVGGAADLQIGAKSSELSNQANQDQIDYGFAFVGSAATGGGALGYPDHQATWAVKIAGQPTLVFNFNHTVDSSTAPGSWFGGGDSVVQPQGGGLSITEFGGQIVSAAAQTSLGAGRVARWGGALTSNGTTATGVSLRQGSTRVTGGFNLANFEVGQFINFGKAAGTVPNFEAFYKIVRTVAGDSDNILYLDRPWPGPTSPEIDHNDYEIFDRLRTRRLGDPYNVGANSALVVEAHQDRLFGARYNPVFKAGSEEETQPYLSRLRWSAAFAENGSGDGDTYTFPTTVDEDLACYGENLWYPNAFVDVFPGRGGGITGLHSIGNSLVIVKESAVYALRGSVSSKGFPSGASIDVVINDSGAQSLRGSAKTSIGVAWANERGLWVYDGNQAVNLADNVVQQAWNKVITNFDDVVVSGCNDRIIVQQPGNNVAWIYNIDRQSFSRQTCHPHTNIIPFNNAGFGTVELGVDDVTGNIIDWSSDFTEDNDEDSENSAFPRLSVQTQPLPADKYPFFTARPHRLYVAGNFTENMDASVILGRGEYDEDFETEDQVPPDDTKPLEYGVEANGYDTVSELRIGGVSSRPAHRFQLTQTEAADRMRLYGIGVEYLNDYTVGQDE